MYFARTSGVQLMSVHSLIQKPRPQATVAALEMCMGIENARYPSLPWDSRGNGNQIAQTNGNGTGMGIAQMGMGTLVINVFPFSHNFPFQICI